MSDKQCIQNWHVHDKMYLVLFILDHLFVHYMECKAVLLPTRK